MKTTITATLLAGVALVACGSPHPQPPKSPPAISAARVLPPWNFDRPIQVVSEPDCAGWYGPASLAYLRNRTHYRAVALVTIDQKADTRWDTPDGKKLTEAQAIAEENSPHRYTPWLMTGWALHVQRVYSGSVPQHLVGYTPGGTLAADSTTYRGSGCLLAEPQPGKEYLIGLGEEIDGRVTASLVRPEIAELLPYNPASNMVTTRGGPMALPDHL